MGLRASIQSDIRQTNTLIILKLEEHFDVCRNDEVCFESLRKYFDLNNSATNDLEVPLPDVPSEPEVDVDIASESSQEVAPIENIIFDAIEYVTFADGLPDHLINISGLIKGIGSMPKPFVATVKANMKTKDFVHYFADAFGLEDHFSRLRGDDSANTLGGVVASIHCPVTIYFEKDPYCGLQSSEEDS